MDFRDRCGNERVAHREIGRQTVVRDHTKKTNAVLNPEFIWKRLYFLHVFFLSAADDEQMDIRNDLRNARKRFEQELKTDFRMLAGETRGVARPLQRPADLSREWLRGMK